MKKAISTLLLSLGVCLMGYAQPKVGSVAPDISLMNPAGERISLSSLQGKVVLIDFWASWCGPCRMSNKGLVKLYSKYKDKGFEIFSVSLDQDSQSWLRAVRNDNMTWTQVIDTKAAAGSALTYTWNIQYLPYTMLIDKEGKLYAIDPDKGKVEKLLKKLL